MVFALLAFLLVSSLSFGVLLLFLRGGRNQDVEVATPRGRRGLIFGGLTSVLAATWPVRAESRERYWQWLRQAGHYHSQAVTEFLALRSVLFAGTLLLVAATIVVATEPGDMGMVTLGIGGLVLLILVFSLPPLVLESMATARKRRIEESLPDAMDMITMCTSAGLPLQQSVLRVADELRSTHPDLAFELQIVGRQTETASLNTAIQQFAKRLDAPEIHSVAAMVWQAEHQGASVANAFHTFADQVRLNRRQRAEEAGNKAAFKMLFPLVFCLAPAVYLMLLGPAVMDLREFFRRERQPGGVLSTTAESVQSAVASGATPGASAPGSPAMTPEAVRSRYPRTLPPGGRANPGPAAPAQRP